MNDDRITMGTDSNMSHRDNSDEIWVVKFDEEHAQKFREKVMKKSYEDPTQPIVIHIDSYGGYVDSLAKMIETLDEVPNPIVTVCMGKAMSCGAILLSHGDLRYCGRHSRVMIHEVSSAEFGCVHDNLNDANESMRLNKHFLGLLAKNCGIKGGYDGLRKIIKERDGRDIWLDARSAHQFGIVDKIGLPRINSVTLYEAADVPIKQIKLGGNTRATYKGTPAAPKKKKVARKKTTKKKTR